MDPKEEAETYLARFTIRKKKVLRKELIPVTLDVTGERMGSPRLADDGRGKEIIELLRNSRRSAKARSPTKIGTDLSKREMTEAFQYSGFFCISVFLFPASDFICVISEIGP